jgi:hypothetical protein
MAGGLSATKTGGKYDFHQARLKRATGESGPGGESAWVQAWPDPSIGFTEKAVSEA